MNQQKNPEQEQQTGTEVTPPPFCHSDETIEAQEPVPTPTLAERIAALGLSEETAQRLTVLTENLDNAAATDELLSTLAQGISHDEDVNNADAAGYLRGRNEKIDVVMRPEPQDDEEAHAAPVFPRYCRRSIWD